MPGFEGTFLGDSSKLHPDTRLECKVCHYIYDPAKGDVDQNIEPFLGTARVLELSGLRLRTRPFYGCARRL